MMHTPDCPNTSRPPSPADTPDALLQKFNTKLDNMPMFIALDVRDCLRSRFATRDGLPLWVTCLECVTPRGRDGWWEGLNDHGILQACLLGMPLFPHNDKEHIQLYNGPRCPCPDRNMLIDALADALLDYENRSREVATQAAHMHERALHSLGGFGPALITFFWLRKRKILSPKRKTVRYTSKTIEKAWRTLGVSPK